MRRAVAVFLMTSLLLGTLGAQLSNDVVASLRVMEWNVENLFDTVHDVGFRDEDFLPQGDYRWTSYRYWRKLKDISKVVAAVTEDGGIPDLIGLCEVENDSVLTMLTERCPLRFLQYEYIMTHCEDERGIDVALLYQPVHFRLLEHRSIRVPSRQHGWRPTRDILYAKGLILSQKQPSGKDTLHVLLAHLPSRVGGYAGDLNRQLAASTLWSVVDSILQNPLANIVLMGDFNAGRSDVIFREAPLAFADDTRYPGTYSFQGLWQWIDHILVSPNVTVSAPASPVRLPWLLEENKTYGSDLPRRTFRGPVYHGGISDHLPLVIDLIF